MSDEPSLAEMLSTLATDVRARHAREGGDVSALTLALFVERAITDGLVVSPSGDVDWATTDPDFPEEIWEKTETRARSHASKWPHVRLLKRHRGLWTDVLR